MQLSPQFEQKWRHEPDDHPRPVNPCMASWAERDHEMENRLSWHPVMHDDGALVTAGRITYPATVPITFQNFLAQAAEVFLVLSLERVANSTHPMREDLRLSAPAMHRVLFRLSHTFALQARFCRECRTEAALPGSLLMYS